MRTIQGANDRRADIESHKNGEFTVYFGTMDGSSFVLRWHKSSRDYRTRKGAERAANAWAKFGR